MEYYQAAPVSYRGFVFEVWLIDLQSWAKIMDEFIKLSKIGFSMECTIAHFSWFFCTNVKIWVSGGRQTTRHQIQYNSKDFLEIFKLPVTLIQSEHIVPSLSVPFHLSCRKIVLKREIMQLFCLRLRSSLAEIHTSSKLTMSFWYLYC